ncbi:MAG: PEP-CTERM sorting domain-containing protein [Phycisphaerae bacterium]
MKKFLGIATALALSGPVLAGTFSMDGQLDGAYGPALALQDTPTGFGNNTNPAIDFANGSELNGAYGVIDGGNLRLMLTGNLESNFNKLDIFIDSVAGGQNQLRGDNADVDFNGLNRMGNDGSGNGLRFDAGFDADYFLTFTGGNDPYQTFANYATLATGGGGPGMFIGGPGGAGPGGILVGSNGITIAIDNSNVGGVDGASINDPSSVLTGIEILIPLSELGNPTGDIRVSAFINGGGHDFLSNQVLGGIGGAGNLGEPRNVDFSAIGGNQYFTVVPEPATLSLLTLGAITLVRRRR